MVVEKDIGGKPIFLRYLPAGSFFGEMGVLSGRPRNATVKAAVGAELIKLTGESFRKMLAARPQVREATEAAVAERAAMTDFIDSRKASDSSSVDLKSDTASYFIKSVSGVETYDLLHSANLSTYGIGSGRGR